MSADPFAGVLDPFAHWNIAATYERYSAFFDVVVYCTIFIALSHVVFLRRFPGRAGKAMATTIGLALGISLAVAGQQYGFSLRAAGPIAVLLLLLLVGFLILHTLLHIQVSWTLAVPLTYVIMYLFLRAMSPALFDTVAQTVPFISLLSVLMFLICVWQIGVHLWPKRAGANLANTNDAGFIARLDRKDEEREVKVEKRLAKHMAPEAYRETSRLENNLEAVRKEMQKDRPDWRAAAQALSEIAHRADDVIRAIDKIRILDRRLKNFDLRELQELSGYYQQLNDSDKERLKEQIQLERGKIIQEHAINQLAERCEQRHGEIRRLLDNAQRACYSGNRDLVLSPVATATAMEEQQRIDLRSLRNSERRLLDLTRLKLKRE